MKHHNLNIIKIYVKFSFRSLQIPTCGFIIKELISISSIQISKYLRRILNTFENMVTENKIKSSEYKK